MKHLFFLFIFSAAILSCDDPSLDQGSDVEEVVEPIFDLEQLSSIVIAENTPTNVTQNIDFDYDDQNLISQISFSGNNILTYSFEYSDNNRLIMATKNDGTSIDYSFTYIEDDVIVSFQDVAGNEVEKILETDSQNRINRIITTVTDMSGTIVDNEDLRYLYNANFNVSRINSVAVNGSTVNSFSEFTYEFNSNPFRDMNDVLRLIIFPEFVPYTRYLPRTRIDYSRTANGFVIDRSFDYDYTLSDNDFPSSRSIVLTENGMTSTTFEMFNYR